MTNNEIIIRWHIEQLADTYYEAHLFRFFELYKERVNRKLSYLKVIAQGNEIEHKILTEKNVNDLLSAIEKINFKFDNCENMFHQDPVIEYKLIIKSENYNLNYKWSTDGIYGNENLYFALKYVIETLCEIRELDYPELGLQLKM